MKRTMIRVRRLACVLVAVLLWSGAHAGLAQGLTPLQLAEMQAVSNATLSDDGRYVAFTRSIPADPQEANESSDQHLFVFDTERDSTWEHLGGVERDARTQSHLSRRQRADADSHRHGKEDTRVHPGQSLELYRHLKVRKPDVPVRLTLYPGEGHGYSRSTARFDYNLRVMRWFDAFLQGDGSMPPSRLDIEEEIATPTSP